MKRVYLPAILFLCFIIEGTIMQVIAPENFGSQLVLVPRFAMIVLILIALYVSIPLAVIYAIAAGLLHDIIYTDFIGIYMFSMAVAAYVVGQAAKVMHINAIVGLLVSFVTVIVLDFLIYGLYSLIGFIDFPLKLFLLERLLPSLILNGGFFILIFAPMKKVIKSVNE